MRSVITIGVSVLSGFAVAFVVLWPVQPAGAGGAVCASQNGDVNADGNINLSDAMILLGHLFLGGPTELVPLCATHPAGAELPDTGQTKCYDEAGNEIPCNMGCRGQDGAYITGRSSEGRFTDNGDGTVTDHSTGLMWQQDTADQDGDGQITMLDRIRWCDALAFCETLIFAGHDDWRLPNIRELQSIADYGRADLMIDPVFSALPLYYWSSTTSATLPGNAWQFFFGGADFSQLDGKDGRHHVRAVRNAP